MFIRYTLTKHKPLYYPCRKFFKNKIPLNDDNFSIAKYPTHMKVKVSGEGNILRSKTFYFNNEENFDSILETLSKEYDSSFLVKEGLKDKVDNIIKTENFFQPETKLGSEAHINELLGVGRMLKLITDKDGDKVSEEFLRLIESIFEKTAKDKQNLHHLKTLHFHIASELERLEKIKTNLDKRATSRVTMYLFLLFAVLVFQTALFYHMIFNVEYLGWDLVEPVTFLFSSIVFILGIFSYVKFHRNAVSGEKMFYDLKRTILLKRYIKNNFNIERYNTLKNTYGVVKKMIADSNKI